MKKFLALLATLAVALLGVAGQAPVSAKPADGPTVAQRAGLHATVSPSKPAVGQTVTSKLTGGAPNTTYYCTLTIYKKGIKGSASTAYSPSIVQIKTNKSGVATCRQTFQKFTASYDGTSHSCPPTKKDKKAGWGCAVGWANSKNLNQTAVGVFQF